MAALAPALPDELVPEALDTAATVGEPNERALAFAALALAVSDKQRPVALREALAGASPTAHPDLRAQVLAQLAPVLPDQQRSSAMRDALAATGTTVTNPHVCAQVLAALAPVLPDTLLAEALAAAATITDADAREQAFAALAPVLPETLVPKAVKAATSITSNGTRVRAVAALVHALPDTVVSEVLEAATRTTDPYVRARAVAALAPGLSDERRGAALRDALAAASTITDPGEQGRALAALAPALPDELIPEALDTAATVGDPNERALVLAALAPTLPDTLVSAAFAVVTSTIAPDARAWVMVALAPALAGEPRAGALHDALDAASAVTVPAARAGALAALAPALADGPRVGALRVALMATSDIADPHASALLLTALAPLLPDTLLPDALQAASTITDQVARALALAALAPGEQCVAAFRAALAAAGATADPYVDGGAEHDAQMHAESLAAPARANPRTVAPEVLAAASTITDPVWREQVLMRLAEPLSDRQCAGALAAATAIEDPDARKRAFARLARLPDDTLPTSLAAAATVADRGSGEHARALAAVLRVRRDASRASLSREARNRARTYNDPYKRAKEVLRLEVERADALRHALHAARTIIDPYMHAWAMAALAPALADEQLASTLREALAGAGAVTASGRRQGAPSPVVGWFTLDEESIVLSSEFEQVLFGRWHVRTLWDGFIAPAIARTLLDEFWSAWDIRAPGERVQALEALAPAIANAQRATILLDALDAASAITTPGLAAHIPDIPSRRTTGALRDNLAATTAIADPHACALALEKLAPVLPDTLVSEAMTAATGMTDTSARTRTLTALSDRFGVLDDRTLLGVWGNELRRAAQAGTSTLVAIAPALQPIVLLLATRRAVSTSMESDFVVSRQPPRRTERHPC